MDATDVSGPFDHSEVSYLSWVTDVYNVTYDLCIWETVESSCLWDANVTSDVSTCADG